MDQVARKAIQVPAFTAIVLEEDTRGGHHITAIATWDARTAHWSSANAARLRDQSQHGRGKPEPFLNLLLLFKAGFGQVYPQERELLVVFKGTGLAQKMSVTISNSRSRNRPYPLYLCKPDYCLYSLVQPGVEVRRQGSEFYIAVDMLRLDADKIAIVKPAFLTEIVSKTKAPEPSTIEAFLWPKGVVDSYVTALPEEYLSELAYYPGDAPVSKARSEYLQFLLRLFGEVDFRYPLGKKGFSVSLRDLFIVPLVREEKATTDYPSKFMMARTKLLAQIQPSVIRQAADVPERDTPPTAVTALIPRSPVLVVLGPPFYGKTSLARYLCLHLADALSQQPPKPCFRLPPGYLPVPLSLGCYHYARMTSATSLLEYVFMQFAEYGLRDMRELIDWHASQGRCFFIFDGLDEVTNYDNRLNVLKEISNFIAKYNIPQAKTGGPSNRFAITSRISAYSDFSRDNPLEEHRANEVTLQAIDHKAFVANWFKKVSLQEKNASAKAKRIQAQRVIDTIAESPRLTALADNPFCLVVMLIGWEKTGVMPEHRVCIYRDIVDTMISTWPPIRNIFSRGITTPVEVTRIAKSVLPTLAFWLHKANPYEFASAGTLVSELANTLRHLEGLSAFTHADAERCLDELRHHNGILARGQGGVGFSYFNLEEYLSAVRLADMFTALTGTEHKDAESFIAAHADNSDWVEPFVLMAAEMGVIRSNPSAVTKVAQILLKSWKGDEEDGSDDPVEPSRENGLELAGMIVAENVGVEESLGKFVVDKLIDRALSGEPSQRYHVHSSTVLLQRFRSTMYQSHITTRLFPILGDPEYASYWGRAASVLAWFGVQEAPQTLISMLGAEGSDYFSRAENALAILGALNGCIALWRKMKELGVMLRLGPGERPDADMVQRKLRGILRRELQGSKNPNTRALAAYLLGNVGMDKAASAALRRAARYDSDGLVRDAAYQALSYPSG